MFILVCTYDSSKNILWTYVGDDCISKTLMQLHIWSKEVIREMKYDEKTRMTEANEVSHENADTCYMCDEIFDEEK